MADDFVSVTPLESTAVRSLSNFHASVSNSFSTLAIEGDLTSRSLKRVDVLVFIGATSGHLANFLAHSRLAPVQVAYWSGTGTTGLGGMTAFDLFSDSKEGGRGNSRKARKEPVPVDHHQAHFDGKSSPLCPAGAVDYFVAPEIILETEAHRAYSEQLVRLPGAGAILPAEIEELPESAKAGSSPQYKFKRGTLYLSPNMCTLWCSATQFQRFTRNSIVSSLTCSRVCQTCKCC